MFSLNDALPMQSYPSKAWFRLVWPCKSLRGTTYLFPTDLFFLHEMANTLKLLTFLIVEYGLVHRGDCINCKTCYFCFNPDFVWSSLSGCTDFHLLS